MNVIEMLSVMDESPYGVYAVDAEQRIIYWNPAAEEILGYRREEVAGLRCYEVCASLPPNGTAPICIEGCPSLALAKQGIKPPVAHVRMRHSSGKRKRVAVLPLIVRTGYDALVAHIFHERMDDAQAVKMAESARSMMAPMPDRVSDDLQPLTSSEVRVLRMVAISVEDVEIAERLGVTLHTVRAHVRNARKKLKARNRLEAVLAARERGLL